MDASDAIEVMEDRCSHSGAVALGKPQRVWWIELAPSGSLRETLITRPGMSRNHSSRIRAEKSDSASAYQIIISPEEVSLPLDYG